MSKRNIIVIGASTGGFEAMQLLIAALPASLQAALFIVWHLPSDAYGVLPTVINNLGTVPAAHAADKEPLRYNRIYVAPPDYHLVLEKDVVRVTHGPKENHFRPAVDPLFRSAALAYGPRVIGIVLSGGLDDGSAGLWAIKQYGGTAIVQDPQEAIASSMPLHAMQAVEVDYVLPIADMAPLLVRLCSEEVTMQNEKEVKDSAKTEAEVQIALQEAVTGEEILKLGELSHYTCPECHGVLMKLQEGKRIRFRCHTGHAFSSDSLLTALTEGIEANFWSVIRNVEESVLLLNHLGDHYAESNQPKLAGQYFNKAKESKNRMEQIRGIMLAHEWLNKEIISEA